MCPICGKYRELTRCVRRMRIAHPTPPRGGGICPIGTTFLGFGPTPPHGVGARPSRSRGRPRLRPSRRRERPDSAFPRRPPAVEGSQALARRGAGRRPLVLARRRENAVSAHREPAGGDGRERSPGASGCLPLPGQRRGRARYRHAIPSRDRIGVKYHLFMP